jgi:PhnB protein
MHVSPYLFFNGNCREAMTFYARTLDGEVAALFTNSEAPPDAKMPGMPDDSVMHAMVVAGGVTLMASDSCPPEDYKAPHGMTVSLQPDSVEAAKKSTPPWPKVRRCRWRWARPSGPRPSPC